MHFKEALSKLMTLRHRIAVVDHLLMTLEDALPDDTGVQGVTLTAPNALPERVPDAVVEQFVAELTTKREALAAELDAIQNLETKHVGKKRS